MKIFLYVTYFFRSARLRGLMNTIRLIRAELRYEKEFGIRTAVIKKSGSTEFFHYQGAGYLTLLRIFNELVDQTRNFHFVDIGSGKGRALFVAEHCGYHHLTGIELDKELVDESRHNAKRYVLRKPDSIITFHHANALEYHYKDELTVYFLFNPFNDVILRDVLQKIKAATHSETWFVYMNPVYRNVFEEEGLEPVKEVMTKRYTEAVVYRLTADRL